MIKRKSIKSYRTQIAQIQNPKKRKYTPRKRNSKSRTQIDTDMYEYHKKKLFVLLLSAEMNEMNVEKST